jgi:hypothetical protein
MELIGLSANQIKPYAFTASELSQIASDISATLTVINALLTALTTQNVTSTDKLS